MLLRITHTYRASFFDLSRETWLLSLVMLVNRAGTMVVPFMSMYITQRMHRSIADAGLIITLFGAGAVLFITLGEMLALPFINTVIMSRSNEHNRGKYAAAFALAFSVAQIAGPAGGALVTEQFGYNILWGELVVLCVGCAAGFIMLGRK